MTLDNSKTIISMRIRLFFATIVLLAWVGVVYVGRLIKSPILGIDDSIWTLALVFIWVVVAFWPMILSYQYVFYSDDGPSLVFRYFPAGIAGGRKNSVEISKTVFSGYKVETKSFGLKKTLILFQKVPSGLAKFPPIYISALTRDQYLQIITSLNQNSPKA
jgi:hypothetical protein